jgi:hypothetical protein
MVELHSKNRDRIGLRLAQVFNAPGEVWKFDFPSFFNHSRKRVWGLFHRRTHTARKQFLKATAVDSHDGKDPIWLETMKMIFFANVTLMYLDFLLHVSCIYVHDASLPSYDYWVNLQILLSLEKSRNMSLRF